MYELWQWHRLTVKGESEIIRRAQLAVVEEFQYHLTMVAHGCPELPKTIEEAKEYFETMETGVVRLKERVVMFDGNETVTTELSEWERERYDKTGKL